MIITLDNSKIIPPIKITISTSIVIICAGEENLTPKILTAKPKRKSIITAAIAIGRTISSKNWSILMRIRINLVFLYIANFCFLYNIHILKIKSTQQKERNYYKKRLPYNGSDLFFHKKLQGCGKIHIHTTGDACSKHIAHSYRSRNIRSK